MLPSVKTQRGRDGEIAAERYLTMTAGLKIIERNWRCALGEIDLIAKNRGGCLVFIEVKSRWSDILSGWESLGRKKQQKLWRLAHVYLRAKRLPLETAVRFDAVLVNLSTKAVLHEPSAFVPEQEF